MAAKLHRTAGIEYYEFAPPTYEQTIVLLHGYGADASDLVPLADAIDTPVDTRWIFLNAPQQVIIDSFTRGRAWFEIDILELSLVMREGQFDRFTQVVPKGLETVRAQILKFIKEKDLDLSTTILGGFSQGSMLSIDVALHLEQNPKALLLLSSSLINSDEWKKLVSKRKGTPFFQSHGTEDPLLRYEIAKKLEGLLTGAGLKGKLHLFNGAHEIPMEIIKKASEFLMKLN